MLPSASLSASSAPFKPSRQFFTSESSESIPETAEHSYTASTYDSLTVTAQRIHHWTVGTYNILSPQPEGKHYDKRTSALGYEQTALGYIRPNTEFRREIIIKNLITADLDIYCLQEVVQEEFQALLDNLSESGYHGIYAPHNPAAQYASSSNLSDGVAILFKAHKFSVLNITPSPFVYQSTTPSVFNPFQQGCQSFLQRAHLITDLQDAQTGTIFRLVSCHLIDPCLFQSRSEKTLQVEALLQSTSDDALTPLPYPIETIIVAGTMNQDQYGDADLDYQGGMQYPDLTQSTLFQPFWRQGYFFDGSFTPSEYKRKVMLDFNCQVISSRRKVDYIFVKTTALEDLSLLPHEINYFDNRGSDHKLVASEITRRFHPQGANSYNFICSRSSTGF